MLPIETKISIPTEVSSIQNTVLSNRNQLHMSLSSSNIDKNISMKHSHYRNIDHHNPSEMIHEHRNSLNFKWNIDNKMIAFKYNSKFDQNIVNSNSNLHQILPYSISLNPLYTSLGSDISASTFNTVLTPEIPANIQLSQFNSSLKNIPNERSSSNVLTQEIKYEKLIPSCPSTNQQPMLTQSYSLPQILSSSMTTTSAVPSTKQKRKYTRRVYQPSVEQTLFKYSNTSSESIFSNCWSSLPLPVMINTLTRPSQCQFAIDLIRTSNFTPLSTSDLSTTSYFLLNTNDSKPNIITIQQNLLPYPTTNIPQQHQTSEQCLSDQKFDHRLETIDNCSTNNLLYNVPYLFTVPHGHYHICHINPMSRDISPVAYSFSSNLNTTLPPLSMTNNMVKLRKKRGDQQKSKAVQTPIEEVLMDENNILSTSLTTKTFILRKHLQKTSKIDNKQIKTLLQRMKKRNKLAVLKFMLQKRKQQQIISKKKFSQIKTENIVPQMIHINVSKPVKIEKKLANIVASNLKITFNTAQKIESVTLYYYKRHQSSINTEPPIIVSNNTDNKLSLLIEAVKYIEMCNNT